jgi:hypothetical protein
MLHGARKKLLLLDANAINRMITEDGFLLGMKREHGENRGCPRNCRR